VVRRHQAVVFAVNHQVRVVIWGKAAISFPSEDGFQLRGISVRVRVELAQDL